MAKCGTILQLAFALWPSVQAAGLRAKAPSHGLPSRDAQVGQQEFAQKPEPLPADGPGPVSELMEQPVRLEDTMGFSDYIEDPVAQGMESQITQYYDSTYNKSEWLAMKPPHLTEEQKDELLSNTNGKMNLCMSGHFVPEFMVIGAIKTSTTSLCVELRRSPALIWSLNKYNSGSSTQNKYPSIYYKWKEGHIFDNHYANETYITNKFPNCTLDKRFVVVEATARYSTDPWVPQRIAGWYGNYKDNLKFMFLIRDPLSRLHSHYWHSVYSGWCEYTQGLSFLQIVDGVFLSNPRRILPRKDRACTDFEKGSLYASQLLGWFGEFSPEQFTLVPFLYNVDPDHYGRSNQTVAEYVWDLLGVRGMTGRTVHANEHKHPPIEKELDPKRMQSMHEYFNRLTGPRVLAKLLVNSGAHLYNYEGATWKVDEIAKWIFDNWGASTSHCTACGDTKPKFGK